MAKPYVTPRVGFDAKAPASKPSYFGVAGNGAFPGGVAKAVGGSIPTPTLKPKKAAGSK